MMKKGLRWIGWVIVWGTALFFVQNGIQKLAGTVQMTSLFHELGLPNEVRLAVGIVELAAGLLLAWPRYTVWGAAALGVTMLGAMGFELAAGHSFEVLLPLQWLIVCVGIAVVRFRARKRAVVRLSHTAGDGVP